MAHSKQAKKRIRQNQNAQLRNKACASTMRTHVKKVLKAVEAGDKTAAVAALPAAMKRIDKAAKHHIIHPNTAARKKSSIQRAVNALAS